MLRQIRKLRLKRCALHSSGAAGEAKNAILPMAESQNGNAGRCFCTDVASKKWDLLSAVCLERHPLVTKPMNEMENSFQEILTRIEFENSMKCDYEMRVEKEKEEEELRKRGILEVDVRAASTQSVLDLEDGGQKELDNFSFAPRIGEKDKDTTFLRRKPDKTLMLLIEQKIGCTTYWIPPQSTRRDGETMRQAAERTLQDLCGPELGAKFYGNAPIGFYKYKYPNEMRKHGCYGAKVFYFLAKYIDGNVLPHVTHRWLDRQELGDALPRPIQRSVSQFLLPD